MQLVASGVERERKKRGKVKREEVRKEGRGEEDEKKSTRARKEVRYRGEGRQKRSSQRGRRGFPLALKSRLDSRRKNVSDGG